MPKKILIFIPYFRPGYKAGGPTKSIENLSQFLVSNNFIVEIICLNEDIDGKKYENIFHYSELIFKNKIKVTYLDKDKISFKLICQLLKKDKFDFVYINSFFDKIFSIKIQILKFLNPRLIKNLIIAPRGEFYHGALSLKKNKKKLFLFFAKIINKNIIFHATSADERETINAIFFNSDVRIAPNIPSISEPKNKSIELNKEKIKFIFLSRISRKKNLKHAVKFILEAPFNCILNIYGPIEDFSYFNECMSLASSHENCDRIKYRETVNPYRINYKFQNHHFLIFPTYGENYGHVISEALSSSLPVLVSANTPWTPIIKKLKCGYLIEEDNINSEVYDSLISLDKKSFELMRQKSRKAYENSLKYNDFNMYIKKVFRENYNV